VGHSTSVSEELTDLVTFSPEGSSLADTISFLVQAPVSWCAWLGNRGEALDTFSQIALDKFAEMLVVI
jgi:hypothetical protein